MPQAREVTLELLDYRVAVLESDRARFVAALETLVLTAETLRATKETMDKIGHWVETVDQRVQTLEVAAPILKMTSDWIVLGVIGIVSLVLMAGYTIIFKGGV